MLGVASCTTTGWLLLAVVVGWEEEVTTGDGCVENVVFFFDALTGSTGLLLVVVSRWEGGVSFSFLLFCFLWLDLLEDDVAAADDD